MVVGPTSSRGIVFWTRQAWSRSSRQSSSRSRAHPHRLSTRNDIHERPENKHLSIRFVGSPCSWGARSISPQSTRAHHLSRAGARFRRGFQLELARGCGCRSAPPQRAALRRNVRSRALHEQNVRPLEREHFRQCPIRSSRSFGFAAVGRSDLLLLGELLRPARLECATAVR